MGEIVKGVRAGKKVAGEVAEAATDLAKKADLIGCFVAGTPVKTQEGEKPIEEIEAGELVYAKNPETGECGYKKVVCVFTKEKTVLIHVRVGEELIKTTTEHPFWVDGYGFKAAEELAVGDYVENAAGELLPVESVERVYPDEPVTVYNFEVEDWHTYYVSEEEILVHNMCMKTVGAKGGTNLIPDNAKTIAQQIKNNNGTPPKGYKGGKAYQNNPLNGEQKLPDGVNYREYDVNPYVKGQGRGTERIVIGDDGSVWYTNDHYQTFQRME